METSTFLFHGIFTTALHNINRGRTALLSFGRSLEGRDLSTFGRQGTWSEHYMQVLASVHVDYRLTHSDAFILTFLGMKAY